VRPKDNKCKEKRITCEGRIPSSKMEFLELKLKSGLRL